MTLEAIDWLLSPAVLALFGLAIGSFLNVVIHRLPIMLERQWLGDAAQYLQDGSAMGRVLGAGSASFGRLAELGSALETELAALPALTLSRPRSRCPLCGHRIAWRQNIPVLGWLRLGGLGDGSWCRRRYDTWASAWVLL